MWSIFRRSPNTRAHGDVDAEIGEVERKGTPGCRERNRCRRTQRHVPECSVSEVGTAGGIVGMQKWLASGRVVSGW